MIYIRCEANDNIGHGHLGRCRAIAEEFDARRIPYKYVTTKESLSTFRNYGIEPEVNGLYNLFYSKKDFVIIDDYRLKGHFKDYGSVLEIEDDVTRPLIRKEFIRGSLLDSVFTGSSGQRALEAAYEGQVLNVKPIVPNQEGYYSHFLANGLITGEGRYAYCLNMKPANKYLASKAIIGFEEADSDFVFNLRNQPYIRKVSFDDKEISHDTHNNWFEVNHTYVKIITAYNKKIGVLFIKDDEISIYFDVKYQGLCYGEVVLDGLKGLHLKAKIKPDNFPSLKLFTRCGFVKNGEYYCRD